MKAIGIDIGGTKINIVLVDEKENILFQEQFLTPKTKKEIIDSIVKVLFKFPHNGVFGIGIGVPGTLNKKQTAIERLPNLKVLNGVKLQRIFEKKVNLPVKLENDVNCMARYSLFFGHGKSVQSLVCITLGTGVGGGIITDRTLFRGKGNAGEWGHMTLDFSKEGKDGEFESLVAQKGFRREMKKAGFSDSIGFIELEKKMKTGNKKAKRVVEKVGQKLGVGIANVILTLDPELVVIGGGLAHYGPVLLKSATKEAKKRVFFPIPPIKFVKDLRHGGAIGAASLFFE